MKLHLNILVISLLGMAGTGYGQQQNVGAAQGVISIRKAIFKLEMAFFRG